MKYSCTNELRHSERRKVWINQKGMRGVWCAELANGFYKTLQLEDPISWRWRGNRWLIIKKHLLVQVICSSGSFARVLGLRVVPTQPKVSRICRRKFDVIGFYLSDYSDQEQQDTTLRRPMDNIYTVYFCLKSAWIPVIEACVATQPWRPCNAISAPGSCLYYECRTND